MLHLPSRLSISLVFTLLLLAVPAFAETLAGRVVAIADGDTLTERREQVRVRLSDIDTPERGQPWGQRSRERLSELAFGRHVEVTVQDTDRYGRTVGRARAGPVDVNATMVRDGAAWVYRRYAKDPRLLQVEDEARTARRGLWGLPEVDRTPPWEWRAAQRRSRDP